ncbi:relaxin-3-like [Microcaecilia unicolor]|uniref:Relaxin-3-like n=1 Tax=Microcaecilia unicolor TaxID=1415580 RepID=A0A6P7XCB5_9AMPH|nr:relaxin-3-like [Microcaecilia unicolor]
MLRISFCHLFCIGLLLAECPGLLGTQGGGEFGVKLCGREFIRAVIYTCGGSRWKRLWTEAVPSELSPKPFSGRASNDSTQTYNKELASLNLQSIFGSDLQQLQKASQSFGQQMFKDSFSLNDDYNEYGPASEDINAYVHQVEEALRGKGAIPPDRYPWEKNHRRKRDFSIGLAGMCCRWGCTKTEISTLC